MDLYYMSVSAPCRAALLTARALKLEVNLKIVDIFAGDQKKPEFVAINPQHCVPTLVDGDLKLWESRAICGYLVNQYGKDDSLYPKCPKKRAQVDRILYFDIGTLWYRFGEYVFPVIFRGQASPEQAKLDKVHEALGWMNDWLDGQDYLVGDNITIADHCCVASVTSFVAAGVDMARHPRLAAWLARCKTNMPGHNENEDGVKAFGEMVMPKLFPK